MRTLYDRCLAFGLSAAGELEEANVSAELEGEPYTSWATCSAFLATEYATMDAKTMLRRTAFDGSSGKMWVRVVAWTSLVSSAAACNAIFGLEPVEQAPVDASPFDTSAHAQDANTPDHFQGDEKDAAPPCVSKADPPIDAGCALGLDDALATFYGDLSSSKLAVTASYVYVVLSGRLVRVPRTLFQAGSGPLPQCLAPLYSFGSPASAALIELTTFEYGHFGVIPKYREPEKRNMGVVTWVRTSALGIVGGSYLSVTSVIRGCVSVVRSGHPKLQAIGCGVSRR